VCYAAPTQNIFLTASWRPLDKNSRRSPSKPGASSPKNRPQKKTRSIGFSFASARIPRRTMPLGKEGLCLITR
jgi:hypothetical protein